MNQNLKNELNEKRKAKAIQALKGAIKALQNEGCDEWHKTVLASHALIAANAEMDQILKSYATTRNGIAV